ncbi:TetR/AcrR family transcriptional regulator [Miniimonas sp. S16]|uniref:TetR/AcrR family transcriptional regulator n=1 Tax=Miniimonas sp. S16 TaxID=2171623 RepID=UPI000D52588C|nr:TetR/AcrR family transcriptional regulator [Miniimonas sp. S16]
MRGTVTRARIVEAAFVVLERAGLAGVTARAVADELGVRAGALYHHVEDMTTLYDEMATAMACEIALPAESPAGTGTGAGLHDGEAAGGGEAGEGGGEGDGEGGADVAGSLALDANWPAMLTAAGHRIRTVLLSHRDGGRLYAGRRLRDVGPATAMEAPLRAMTAAGLDLGVAVTALQAVADLTVGFVIEEQHRDSGESGAYDPEARRAFVDAERHPLTAAASAPMLAPGDERFATALGFVVDGVRARLPR